MTTLDTSVNLVSFAAFSEYYKDIASGDEDMVNQIINAVSVGINTYLGRHIKTKAHTEYYSGNGLNELQLNQFPIISLTSLHIADSNRNFDSADLIDSGDIIIKKDAGVLRLWNNESIFQRGNINVKVIYTAGYTTIPADIIQAANSWIASSYTKQDKHLHVQQSENIGSQTTTYTIVRMPPDVEQFLEPHKKYFNAPDFEYEE